MAVNVKLVERKNPMKPMLAPKVYGVVKSVQNVDLDYIAEKLSKNSPLSEGTVLCILRDLIDEVSTVLQLGHTVRLGEFGSFRVTLRTEGAENEAGFSADNIKRVCVRFLPGNRLKETVKKVAFQIDKEPVAEEPASEEV